MQAFAANQGYVVSLYDPTGFAPASYNNGNGASSYNLGYGFPPPLGFTFSSRAAPGAPAPLLGLGLLPALAGAGGFAVTRVGRKAAITV